MNVSLNRKLTVRIKDDVVVFIGVRLTSFFRKSLHAAPTVFSPSDDVDFYLHGILCIFINL